MASAAAIARTFPLFSRKSKAKSSKRTVTVEFVLTDKGDKSLSDKDATSLSVMAESIRLSAKIVDIPCNDMHTDAFLEVEQSSNFKCVYF